MITEKVQALGEAQTAAAIAAISGRNRRHVAKKVLSVYKKRVRGNRRRLAKQMVNFKVPDCALVNCPRQMRKFRRDADSRNWLGTYPFQMAAHASFQTVYATEVIRCPLWVKSGHSRNKLNKQKDRLMQAV